MDRLWMVPAVLQAGAILVDEVHFHRKRGLGGWELYGHPVDTVFFLLPLSIAAFVPHTPSALKKYFVLSLFSCLLVTKDEWVHAKLCTPAEHWLHSVLFLLHPVVLFAAEKVWAASAGGDFWAIGFRAIQLMAVGVFLIYQLLSLLSARSRKHCAAR